MASRFDDFHFLLEAKWTKGRVERAQLDAFRAKVDEKAESTMGLLLSIEGFQPEGVRKHDGRRSPLLLMDGADLLAVLEQRVDMVDLLRAKRRHAAMTGEIYRGAGSFRDLCCAYMPARAISSTETDSLGAT